MERTLGADFSNVRVHVGPQPGRIGALAFTSGSDIFFAPGQYQPQTATGLRLIGHELAHVLQQRAGRVRNPSPSGVAVIQDRLLEAEADRAAHRAAAACITAPRTVPPGAASQRSASPGSTAGRHSPVQGYLLGGLGLAGLLGLVGIYNYYHTVPTRTNRQPQHYEAEVGNYLRGWRETRQDPYNLQVFRVTFNDNAGEFRNRVRSGVRFIWALTVDGRLGIASMQNTQHPIAAQGADVIGAGEGQLARAVDNPELTAADAANAQLTTARQRTRGAWQRTVEKLQNPASQGPTVKNLMENSLALRQMGQDMMADVPAEPVWRNAGDDIVYLNLQSGHYTPELSGRFFRSRVWSYAFAAWRQAGFDARREPGSNWV
jgi:hypothetical protein